MLSAHVASLPLPRHREQIVWIHRREIAGHEAIDEGVHLVEPERPVSVFAEKIGTPPHHRPQFGLALEAGGDIGRRAVACPVEPRIGSNCFVECLGEHEIVLGIPGGTGDRGGALDEVGITHGPFVGLLCAHRATDDERQALRPHLPVNRLCWARTSSPMRTFGKAGPACAPPVLWGEVDRPFPILFTTIIKYFSGSSARPSPIYTCSMILLVPEYRSERE